MRRPPVSIRWPKRRRKWFPRPRRRFSAFAAPPVWDPQTVAGLLANLDATQGTYTDVAETILATSDATQVKGWRDWVSGADFKLQAAGTATGPALKTSVSPTSLNALRWNGTSNILICQLLALATLFRGTTHDFTIFWALGAIGANAIVQSWNPAASNVSYGYCKTRDSTYSPNAQTIFRDYDDAVPAHDNVAIATGWHIVCASYSASTGNVTIYTDSDAGNAHSTTEGANSSAGIDQVVLGGIVRPAAPNGQLFGAFDLGQLLVYNVALSDADRIYVRNGLAAKWIGVPDAPTGVTVRACYRSHLITWTAGLGAQTHTVQRSLDGATGWTTIATGLTATYTFDMGTDQAGGHLADSTIYYYRVYSTNTAGNSANSSVANGTTLAVLDDPTDIAPTTAYWCTEDLGAAGSSITSWADRGSGSSRALAQGTAGFKPVVATNGNGGTATKVWDLDGTDDWLSCDAIGSVFMTEVSFAMVRKLGSMAGRTGNETDFIADKSGTDTPTFDEYVSNPSNVMVHCDQRTDGSVEESLGCWERDTASYHVAGSCKDAAGKGQLFLDGTLTQEVTFSSGAVMTANMFTVGAHRRTSTTGWMLATCGDVVVYPYRLNATQWGYLQTLLSARFNTAASPGADPLQFVSGVVASHRSDAFLAAAGGTLADGTAVTDVAPRTGYLCERTAGGGTITYETAESPTGKPMTKLGAGAVWLENTPGQIAGKVTGGGAFKLWWVAKATSLSGSAQSFLSLTRNGPTNAFLTVRVKAGPVYEIETLDDNSMSYSTSGGAPDTNIHAFVLDYNGTEAVRLYVDGTLVITHTMFPNTLWTFLRYVFGCLYRGSVSEQFSGLEVGEDGIATGTLSDADRASIFSYAVTYWGTPTTATGHPALRRWGGVRYMAPGPIPAGRGW